MAGTTTPNMDSINLDQACKFLIQDDPDFKKQVKAMMKMSFIQMQVVILFTSICLLCH